MAFHTDGRSHRIGVLNEKNIVAKLKESIQLARSVYPECPPLYEVHHVGGTKNKADAIIKHSIDQAKGISLKNKTSAATGSHDWINAGLKKRGWYKYIPFAIKAREDAMALKGTYDIFNPKEFCPGILTRKQPKNWSEYYTKTGVSTSYNKCKGDSCDRKICVERARKKVASAACKDLESLSKHPEGQALLWMFIQDLVIKPNLDLIISIHDNKQKKLCSFEFENHPVYEEHQKRSIISVSSPRDQDTQTSRMLCFNGERNCGLRIRAVLNNGVNALIGVNHQLKEKGLVRPNKNTDSHIGFKIQQDGVHKILDCIEKKGNLRVCNL